MRIEKANLELRTPREISEWCESMRRGWGDRATLHHEANIVARICADRPGVVLSRSAWAALIDGSVASYGTHDDVLESTVASDGGVVWRFRRRVVRHLWSA